MIKIPRFDMGKHGNIGPDAIPDGVGRLLHYGIRLGDTDYGALIHNADYDLAPAELAKATTSFLISGVYCTLYSINSLSRFSMRSIS